MSRLRSIAVIATALAIAVLATACSTSGSPVADRTSAPSVHSPSSSSEATAERLTSADIERAIYLRSGSTGVGIRPEAFFHITAETQLPTEVAAIADLAECSGGIVIESSGWVCRMFQQQDKSVVVRLQNRGGGGHAVVIDQSGTARDTTSFETDRDAPQPFDLSRSTSANYFGVLGGTLPASAGGNADDMYFLSVLPDAFDDELFWLLPRGGTVLYKADLRAA